MNRWYKPFQENREDRSRRPLSVGQFKPINQEEYLIHEIAKAVGEKEVRYLLSIYYRYGYHVIQKAWEEMRSAMTARYTIRSPKKFLNHLIQKQIQNSFFKGGEDK